MPLSLLLLTVILMVKTDFKMNQNIKLKQVESHATNREFYDLFRPIIPSMDLTGKIAQVISALTEAVTVWFIMQSELAGVTKVVSIALSILAVILVVAVLELGGRKFLQVLTRALVWKRLQNKWYKLLFTIVAIMTIGLGILSFKLSTNGIHHTFTSKATLNAIELDHSALNQEYQARLDRVDKRFAQDLKLLEESHYRIMQSLDNQYDAKANEALLKAGNYEQKSQKGAKWAISHANKYKATAANLVTTKTNKLAALNEKHSNQLAVWKTHRQKAIDREQKRLDNNIAKATIVKSKRAASELKVADFWGSLFSGLVGFTIILAFFCIITVEVFRRGSGITVAYEEVENHPSTLALLWTGVKSKANNAFRKQAEKLVALPPAVPQRTIGFQPTHTPSFVNELEEE